MYSQWWSKEFYLGGLNMVSRQKWFQGRGMEEIFFFDKKNQMVQGMEEI